jgi:hypothetical protein
MNLKFGSWGSQFLFWEYLFSIFGIGSLQCGFRFAMFKIITGIVSYKTNIFESPKKQYSALLLARELMVFTIIVKKIQKHFLLASMKSHTLIVKILPVSLFGKLVPAFQ